MAALQSIRKHGGLLIAIIGFALFAFVAGDLFKSCEWLGLSKKNMAASMYGNDTNIQDYQQLELSAMELAKLQSGTNNLGPEREAQVKEEVWQFYQWRNIIEHEAGELGLKVTEAEIQRVMSKGNSQSLRMFYQIFFGNQPYEHKSLQELLKQCKDFVENNKASAEAEQADHILKSWEYVQDQIRVELLSNKYMCLLQSSDLPSPTEEKATLNNLLNQSTIAIAAISTSEITDAEAKASDKDIEELYETYKEEFALSQETRDIKYIDVEVTPSAADRQALSEKMTEAYNQLVAGEDVKSATAGLNNRTGFADICLSKSVYPYDVQSHLETMTVGDVTPVYFEAGDTTMNVLKLVGTKELPENISLRVIPVNGKDEKEVATRADSIMKALDGGANFADVASKYGVPADTMNQNISEMIERDQQGRPMRYQNISRMVNEQFREYYNALTTLGVGYHKLTIGGMTQVLQIIDRKDFTTKYNVAVVKVPVEYSNETYNKMVNDLNRFISQNTTVADMEKNAAKNGYAVKEISSFNTGMHEMNGVTGISAVVKWIFGEDTKESNISTLFQDCGRDRNHLMVVAVTAINDDDYLPSSNKAVKETLTPMAAAKAKSAAAFKKLASVNTIEDAQKQGLSVDTVSNVCIGNPMLDPKVAAAAARLKAGETTKVQALSGAYIIKAVSKETVTEDNFMVQQALDQRNYIKNLEFDRNIQNVLYRNAKIVDNRYKF